VGNFLIGAEIVANWIKFPKIHCCLVASLAFSAPSGNAFGLKHIVLSVPGPGSMGYLPAQLEMANRADRAEGFELKLQYFPGGLMAMRDLRDKNGDFAEVSFPAITTARTDGMPVIAVAQRSQGAMVSLMLRQEFKDTIEAIARLKGARIGTNTNTRTACSTSPMQVEYVLARACFSNIEVQFVPTGQNREAQRAALPLSLPNP
jgi:ABC-type nitrate/sulfonate/bicarbonate transport system substrate-binding protein